MLDFTTFREQTSYYEEIDALAEQYDINHRIAKRVKEELVKKLINHYEKKITPIMPVNANFLMKKYKIPEGKQLGDKLRIIEDKWVKNNFRISDEDIDSIVNRC